MIPSFGLGVGPVVSHDAQKIAQRRQLAAILVAAFKQFLFSDNITQPAESMPAVQAGAIRGLLSGGRVNRGGELAKGLESRVAQEDPGPCRPPD
jgi:hypothetical protein